MKKAVFMTATPGNIDRAYPKALRSEMEKELSFLPKIYSGKESEEELSALREVSFIFSTWGMPALTGEQITNYLPKLECVFYGAGTVQAFARPFLEKGIGVFSAWGANAIPVAEVTVSEIILANKGVYQRFQYEDGAWANRRAGGDYPGNYGTNVGIIGAGMIGKLVISMLKAYRLNVYVFDPFLPDEKAAELGVTKVEELPELFGICQTVSNHLANNKETVGMIDKKCFDRMPDNGVFLNTGRGAQVVEADLIAALKEKPNRAAVLDVTFPEPPAEGSELYRMRNVILTPHLAGSLGAEVGRMGEFMFEEYRLYASGKPTRYGVTEAMLATMA